MTKKFQEPIWERQQAQAALEILAQELEAGVEARTTELSRTNEYLKQEIAERKVAEAALQASELRER